MITVDEHFHGVQIRSRGLSFTVTHPKDTQTFLDLFSFLVREIPFFFSLVVVLMVSSH